MVLKRVEMRGSEDAHPAWEVATSHVFFKSSYLVASHLVDFDKVTWIKNEEIERIHYSTHGCDNGLSRILPSVHDCPEFGLRVPYWYSASINAMVA